MSLPDLFVLLVLVLLLTIALALTVVGSGLMLGTRASDKAQSSAAPLALLNRQWRIERGIYRHHRLAGLLTIAAAAFFFFKTWHFGLLEPARLSDTWRLTILLLAVGNLFNLVIGLVLLLRPSRLKPVENLSNRWIEVDVQEMLRERPRLRGTLIVLISLVCAAGFGAFLLILLRF
ncbi:MAG: hypothetical protein EA370_12995 [Wenzhouxiangella sp.]|nr:MAG: hypothetical protein EA370_12995 [Wenzhouxiangella sp.]